MSGRSAASRAKIHEQADKRAFKEIAEHNDDPYLYGYTGAPVTRGQTSGNPSYRSPLSPPPHIRRRSHSSQGSHYGYPTAPHLSKPRPIVIASAIEKSDFRTHLDGMSSNLRGKIGGFIKGNKKELEKPKRRPTTTSSTTGSDFDFTTRTTEVTTPSVGNVPSLTHASTVPSEAPSLFSQHSYSLPTRERQRPQAESVIQKIRRFEGGGKLPQLGWKSLSNNPELWDENGDTFVYMYMRGSRTKPPPSFRVNSAIIQQSGSKLLIDQLYNVKEPDGWPRFRPDGFDSSQSESSDYHSENYDGFRSPQDSARSSASVSGSDSEGILPIGGIRKAGPRAPRGIRHEIYISWPGQESGTHSTIWHITTRNFFAVMFNASSLVGTTLHEAMVKLFERVTTHADYLDPGMDRVAWVTDYLVRHKFDDVRNNPSYAASLLAISENPNVQWREGYIEAFVHCVGMLHMGLQTIPEWRYITPHTKMYLENANMEIEERIHRAQAWLVSFDFSEMWSPSMAPQSAARGCFDRLRRWFCKYYENAFLHWPPSSDTTWLTRDLVVRLRNDFYGLYDYLVDRDIIFDGTEYRPGQKWAITSRTGANFRADTYELPFTDLLLSFDNRNEFPHMPHPYPITPPSVPLLTKSKSTFSLNKKSLSPAETTAQSRRKSLSYAEASNVYTLRDQYVHTDLVTNFIRFEQGDHVESLDPFEARRGRWILIYGILQVLATVSVDSPNIRYKEGAQYHLSPQMKGVVPWAAQGAAGEPEASHSMSHCWTIPKTWGEPAAPKARVGAHKPILWGPYGDGRSRGESMDSVPTTTRAGGAGTSVGGVKTGGRSTPAAPRSVAGGSASSIREISTSRKRAEEWVANTSVDVTVHRTTSTSPPTATAGGMNVDGPSLSGDLPPVITAGTSGGNGNSRAASRGRAQRTTSSSKEAAGNLSGGGMMTGTDDSNDDTESASAAEDHLRAVENRRRRAVAHGFTDFKVPSEW